jgi:ankyrin repeat protein
VYSLVIKGLVLQWKLMKRGLENVILADEFLQHVSKKTLDVSHLYFTAIFTVLVSPFSVWCEPTLPLTKIQRKRSFAKLFLPLSNLFLITMLSMCIFACATMDNFKVNQTPPLSFCFPIDNATDRVVFFTVINSNRTSETTQMLTFCNTDDCHPAIRACQNGEQPTDLFATTICPFLIGLLILSFALSLILSYLSNFDNLLNLSQCKIIHPVFLQKYLKSNDTDEKRITQMINNSSPDILNFSDPLTGNTCLHAAYIGMTYSNFKIEKINILKQLVLYGGKVKSENKKGDTLQSLLEEIKRVLDAKSKRKCNIRDNRERIVSGGLLDLLSEPDNKQNRSRLMDFALRNNNLTLMKLFFWLGGNLESRNEKNLTPLLSKLAEINDEKTTQKIKQLTKMCVLILNLVGSEQTKTDKEKDIVLDFIKKHVQNTPNLKLIPEKLHSLFIYEGMQFINGDTELEPFLKYLINIGCKINYPNMYNSENPELTLLHMSCDSGNFTATQFLVTEDAKIDQRDSLGWTPLHYAVRKGNFNIVKFLTKEKADVNITNLEGKTALHLAFQNWKLEIASHLIGKVSDINVADHDGMTLLHYASKHQQDKIVKLLIEKKASFDKKDGKGKTPLHLVSENRSNYEPRNGGRCCKLLLIAAGRPDDKLKIVNFCDNYERTALHDAVDTMSPDATIVKLLIENGANVNKVDAFGKTPLNYITASDTMTPVKIEINKLLEEADAKTNPPSKNSRLTFSLSIIRPHRRLYLAEAEEISHIENRNYVRTEKYKRRKVIKIVSVCWLFIRKKLGKHPPGKYSASVRLYVDQETYFTKEGPFMKMIVNKIPPQASGNQAAGIPLLTVSFPYNTWSDLANGQYEGEQKIDADTTSDNWYWVYLDQFETDCFEELEFVLEDKSACWKGSMKLDCIDLYLDSLKPGKLLDSGFNCIDILKKHIHYR